MAGAHYFEGLTTQISKRKILYPPDTLMRTQAPSIFTRCAGLLCLLTLLAISLILSAIEPAQRKSETFEAARINGSAATLITFTTRLDRSFRTLSLQERSLLVREGKTALLKQAGIRHEPSSTFAFSRGLALEVTARQLMRLSRLRMVSQIEPIHPERFETIEPLRDQLLHISRRSNAEPSSPVIAVVDSGLGRIYHEASASVVDEACFCSRGTLGCCPLEDYRAFGPLSAEDESGHGTSVTYLALQATATIYQHPVGVIPVKVVDSHSGICCPVDIVSAFDWIALRHPGISVVNMSLSIGPRFRNYCDEQRGSGLLIADAISAIQRNDTLIIAASGNDEDPDGMGFPACVEGVLAVGAVYADSYPEDKRPKKGCQDPVQQKNQVTCFSNASDALDLLAPGAYLTAPLTGGNWRTQSLHGTSFAAPQVAGCALGIRARFPDLSSAEVTSALLASPTMIEDHRSGNSWPLLDCQASLDHAAGLSTRSVGGAIPTRQTTSVARAPLYTATSLGIAFE